MPAFIQNINPTELVLIAIVAILIFGRRLPQVAGQVAGRVQQARRAFNDLKRETGIDEELRQAKRTFDQTVHDARFRAQRDPAAPRIETPSSGAAVGRGNATPDPAAPAPPAGGPSDGPHGGPGPVGERPASEAGAEETPDRDDGAPSQG